MATPLSRKALAENSGDRCRAVILSIVFPECLEFFVYLDTMRSLAGLAARYLTSC